MEKEILKATNELGLGPMRILEELSKYIIFYFTPSEVDKKEWPYKDKENRVFYTLMAAMFEEYKKGIYTRGWCDPWGQCYEAFISSSKSSITGQFFTPPDVCELMTQILIDGSLDSEKTDCGAFGNRVICSDPTCGSGRNLLSTAARFAGKSKDTLPYFIGEDIDPMCCRMTAINLMAHGVPGEVICHDALAKPDELNFGYVVNEGMFPLYGGLPTIRMFTDKDRFVYFRMMRYKYVQPKQTNSELTLNFE